MSYTVTTTFVDGDPTDASDAGGEVNLAMGYVNDGVVVGDIDAASIDSHHLFRPELRASPVQGQVGEIQSVFVERHGMHERPIRMKTNFTATTAINNPVLNWAKKAERVSIFLDALGPDDSTPIPGMSRRIVIPGPKSYYVHIWCQWEAVAMYDPGSASPGRIPVASYPANTGGGALPSGDDGGFFDLRYQRVASPESGAHTSNTLLGSARRHFYPEIAANIAGGAADMAMSPRIMNYNTFGWFEVLTGQKGVYDVWLEYNANVGNSRGANADMSQVSIGTRNMVVELFAQ